MHTSERITALFSWAALPALIAAIPSTSQADQQSGISKPHLSAGPLQPVGVARVDITPDYPVLLAGYASRNNESEGVTQRLWAKALAIGGDEAGAALLITVDNCMVPASVVDEVARRLAEQQNIPRERVVVCATHAHSAPWLAGAVPLMFGRPTPPEQQAHVERYTRHLIDCLEQVAAAALADRRPAALAWNQGQAGFAINRRPLKNGRCEGIGVNPGGAVDHALPMLRVTDADGRVRAVVVNYACHCTALGSEFKQICGDWAGFAAEYVERDFPGAICLVTIGCGGDANPNPRLGLDYARQHGSEIAREVKRLISLRAEPLVVPPVCRFARVMLPLDKLPTREEWAQRAKQPGPPGYYASVQLARLDRGEQLRAELPYAVQTWCFGGRLAMIFMAGEVVVDYAARFKKEFGAERVWVTAYANDVPCYIPSRRVLAEGGYEADVAMMYYDLPTHFAPQVEELIDTAVRGIMPATLNAPASRPE